MSSFNYPRKEDIRLDAVTGVIALSAAFSVAVATIGPAIGQGSATSKAMDGIARQPEAASEIRSTLIVALAFMEALTIYGLLIALILVSKIK